MTKKGHRLSDEIRAAIASSELTRQEICKELSLDKGAMSRFMTDKGGLSMEVLDRLAALLGFGIVVRGEEKSRPKA